MAVDKKKVISRIKTLFPKANLSQKRLDALADKLAKKPADDADDDAIDAVLNDFNDIQSFEDLAKEDDRVRTLEADKKKAEDKAKKVNSNSDDDSEEDEEEDDTNLSPTDKILKGLVKTVGKLAEDVSGIKSGNVKQTKLQEAQGLLEKSEVFKSLDEEAQKFMLKNVDLESETPFDEQITGLEGVFSKFAQGSADNNQYATPAGGGNANELVVDQSVVDKMVENL